MSESVVFRIVPATPERRSPWTIAPVPGGRWVVAWAGYRAPEFLSRNSLGLCFDEWPRGYRFPSKTDAAETLYAFLTRPTHHAGAEYPGFPPEKARAVVDLALTEAA